MRKQRCTKAIRRAGADCAMRKSEALVFNSDGARRHLCGRQVQRRPCAMPLSVLDLSWSNEAATIALATCAVTEEP